MHPSNPPDPLLRRSGKLPRYRPPIPLPVEMTVAHWKKAKKGHKKTGVSAHLRKIEACHKPIDLMAEIVHGKEHFRKVWYKHMPYGQKFNIYFDELCRHVDSILQNADHDLHNALNILQEAMHKYKLDQKQYVEGVVKELHPLFGTELKTQTRNGWQYYWIG